MIRFEEAAKIAEDWAEENLGMKKAEVNQKGYDGTLPNKRRLQVKSKKHGAHRASGAYIELNEDGISGNDAADDLLIVFVDWETGKVTGTVGPVPIDCLISKAQKRYRWTEKQIRETKCNI